MFVALTTEQKDCLTIAEVEKAEAVFAEMKRILEAPIKDAVSYTHLDVYKRQCQGADGAVHGAVLRHQLRFSRRPVGSHDTLDAVK